MYLLVCVCVCVLLDVCNSTDLPEFEIISLLEEQLPVYRLRADTVYGYDNDDWLHTPLIAPDAQLELTAEQIEETLKYFCECVGVCVCVCVLFVLMGVLVCVCLCL